MQHIDCPNCGHKFDVEEALSGKLEDHFKKEFERKLAESTRQIRDQQDKLEKERQQLESERQAEAERLNQKLQGLLIQERSKIEARLNEGFAEKFKSLEEEISQRRNENKALKERELQLMRRESALKERQEEMKVEVEKEMLRRQQEIESKARVKERESFELEKLKLLKQIDDNKKLAEEMRRKAEQGSMQLQGEVQEIALEDLLAQAYPFDMIDEVSKGVRGADIIQSVVNTAQQVCGKIVYESKRTKNFANDWIDKLKQDQVTCKADLAVIVTETMPAGMDKFGAMEGVWVCGFHEVKSLSFVLREMLIRVNSVQLAQSNKGDKKEMLYAYLTSNEFVQHIRRIIENYDGMISQLNSEKRAMQKNWAIREKQIWMVTENISALFGSIKGIAGGSLESGDILELPEREIEP